jgi:hypothetical protein
MCTTITNKPSNLKIIIPVNINNNNKFFKKKTYLPTRACCEGEFRGANSKASMKIENEPRINCVGCLPSFYSIGPEKTGTTDLYNRISMLRGVIPAHRKETAW